MGGSNSKPAATPAAYTWNPAPPGQPEFTSSPTAALASTSGGASPVQSKPAGNAANTSYTGTVLGN